MKLSDNEIRDITKLLEAGKPLPDRYRFMLFGDDREIELVWNGKSADVTNVVLPFQTIEHVDEPRPEEDIARQPDLFDLATGRQLKGWTNKLIWGDNKFVLSSLKNGPLREEIEANGGIKLIYIDPPFDVGADFTMDVEIGEQTISKSPNVLEEIAYRDTWGRGSDSFLSMLYERIVLMKELLAHDGSIYVHVAPTVSHSVKILLDEIFDAKNFRSEVVWRRSNAHNKITDQYGPIHEIILFYTKSEDYQFHPGETPFSKGYIETRFKYKDERGVYQPNYLTGPGTRSGDSGSPWRGFDPTSKKRHWAIPRAIKDLLPIETSGMKTQEILDLCLENDLLVIPKKQGGQPMYKQYMTEGVPYQDIWAYQPNTRGTLYGTDGGIDEDVKWLEQEAEKTGYPTQKPEGLIRRILETSSNPGDIVCDFFLGSGSTATIAEKMGRKWICSDLGKFSIHTTRKRMIGVQRELKKEGKDYRAFEVLNLGKYESDYFVSGLEPQDGATEDQKERNRELAFNTLILQAYQAEPVEGFTTFRGKKNNRLVSIGPVNMPVSRLFVEEVIQECLDKGITKADLLAFEFEMGLFPNIQEDAAQKGVDIVLKYIPKDVFDKRAVDKGEAKFHDVAYIDAKPLFDGNKVAIELTNYSVFYTQGAISFAEEKLKNGGSQIVVANGQVIKISKDKDGMLNQREVLTKKWEDWIDYWSIDFDFESKKEIIHLKDPDTGEVKQTETGNFIFENEWQSFRTRQDRSLDLKSVFWEMPPGRHKIAVKVVDIFGNDTMKVLTVTIGGEV